MYEEIKGKKLLILAGGPNLVTLVERAKELGVYTVVTDYYDISDSPAKLVADEYWNTSWSDIDALEKKCKENGIDGITTGYSENVVEACIKLCERLNLPCYSNMEQLEVTRNKDKFKESCRENAVPVVKEYKSINEVETFPIIVKPVDRAGSIGVGVAQNKEELKRVYDYAMEMSYSKKVIIEDFIYNGTKFDVIYGVCDGNICLLSSSDTISAKNNGFEKVVQSGWIFPSKYQDIFLKKVDSSIRNMIKNLGIQNGCIFYSGFAIPKENDVDFVFFETGFRLSGGHLYNYTNKKEIINILDIFIIHALIGKANLTFNSDKQPDLKYLMVNYYLTDGTISKVSGIDEIRKNSDCNFILNLARIGKKCDSSKAILTKGAMIHLCNKSIDKLAEDLKVVNHLYSVENENKEDMIYDRIEPSLIKNWYKK